MVYSCHCAIDSGEIGDSDDHHPFGYLVGQVGARFERPNHMESLYITEREEEKRPPKGSALDQALGYYFNNQDRDKMYTIPWGSEWESTKYLMRIKDAALAFLVEANSRGKSVYCHVVGLGLGAWNSDMSDNLKAHAARQYYGAYKEVILSTV